MSKIFAEILWIHISCLNREWLEVCQLGDVTEPDVLRQTFLDAEILQFLAIRQYLKDFNWVFSETKFKTLQSLVPGIDQGRQSRMVNISKVDFQIFKLCAALNDFINIFDVTVAIQIDAPWQARRNPPDRSFAWLTT